MKIKFFLILGFIMIFSTGIAFAEPIMITISADMNKVIFDGKWSFTREWKGSSLNTLTYGDGSVIQLRTGHQDNFIYIFIDAVSLGGSNPYSDMAVICFDKNNGKSEIPNDDDYCFLTTLEGKNPVVLQGGSPLIETNHFKKIPTPDGVIAVGGISDVNDRYTVSPHTSYEFRIPTDVVGRTDTYGFYLGVYDKQSNKTYSWPQNITSSIPMEIPNPSKWGEIISPDKSLPEFPWPFLSLLIAMTSTIYLARKRSHLKTGQNVL